MSAVAGAASHGWGCSRSCSPAWACLRSLRRAPPASARSPATQPWTVWRWKRRRRPRPGFARKRRRCCSRRRAKRAAAADVSWSAPAGGAAFRVAWSRLAPLLQGARRRPGRRACAVVGVARSRLTPLLPHGGIRSLRLRTETSRAAAHAGGRRKNSRAVAVLLAAVTATSSPRSRASSSTMCARYMGSLRRCEGAGLTVRGSR